MRSCPSSIPKDLFNIQYIGLGLNIVDNKNIDSPEPGGKELHLNQRGVGNFAANLINKLRSF